MAASTGPAHGTITSPRLAPSRKPPPDVASAAAREARERPFDEHADAREDQRRRDEEEERERDVSQQVERQPEEVEQPRGEEHGEREADDETRDDRVRAAWPARGRAREERREAPAVRTATAP